MAVNTRGLVLSRCHEVVLTCQAVWRTTINSIVNMLASCFRLHQLAVDSVGIDVST
jgi:hypothetical protein